MAQTRYDVTRLTVMRLLSAGTEVTLETKQGRIVLVFDRTEKRAPVIPHALTIAEEKARPAMT